MARRRRGEIRRGWDRSELHSMDYRGRHLVGYGTNFPGAVAEWRWVQPEGPPLQLHVARLAQSMRLLDDQAKSEIKEAALACCRRALGGRPPDIEAIVAWGAQAFEVEDVDLALHFMGMGMALVMASLDNEAQVQRPAEEEEEETGALPPNEPIME